MFKKTTIFLNLGYNYFMNEIENIEKKQKTKKVKIHSPIQRILTKIIIILILICAMMGFGYFGWKKGSETVIEKKSILMKDSLTYWQEFVTLKYRYSDIVSVKKSNFFTSSYTLVKYTGVLRAGIPDLTECDIKISPDGKKITIKLTDAVVLGNDLESQEVFDEQKSIFIDLPTSEVFNEIEKSRKYAMQDLLDEGILDDAKEYAKEILKQICYTAGYEQVEIN